MLVGDSKVGSFEIYGDHVAHAAIARQRVCATDHHEAMRIRWIFAQTAAKVAIRDNQDPLIRGFQFELWALATRDRFAAKCRDRMTGMYCEFILKLVQPLTPDLPLAQQRQKAAVILALLQGVPLIVGKGVISTFPPETCRAGSGRKSSKSSASSGRKASPTQTDPTD